MNRIFSGLLLALIALTVMSCDKEDTIVDQPVTENPTFTSANVKEGAVYYSFDTKQSVPVWDLVFKSNGPSPDFYLNTLKIGGKQVVGIYSTDLTDFEAVTSANLAQISSDTDVNISGGNWYNYDMNTHQISSKGLVYVVYGASDYMYKFRIEGYTANVYTLKYARYNSSSKTFEAAKTAAVDKTAGEAMFSFAQGLVAEQKNWDVKLTIIPTEIPSAGIFSFPGIMLNSEKNVAAKTITDKQFADVDAAATTGLVSDTPEAAVIGTDWFNYDQNTHIITSKGHTYVLQTAGGKRTKFRVINYYNNDNQSGYFKIEHTDAK